MSVTPETFRAQFPEFEDAGAFPDDAIQLWITVATDGSVSPPLLDPTRWGSLLDLGTSLFTAHNLVLGKRDQAAAEAGGLGGTAQGILTAKAVDKVSASYDSVSVMMKDGGFWNMSSYGIRFLTYARMIGAGGLQF